MAALAALTLNGLLNVVGDASALLQFPVGAGSSSAGAAGAVQVSGGVGLAGAAGPVRISIAGSGSASGEAQVAAGDVFSSSGALLGLTARLLVRGVLELSGSVIEPALELYASSRVVLQTAAGARTYAGNVSFAGASELVINGTASSYGEQLTFEKIANCPAGSQITFNVVGSASAAVASGFTLFNYGSATFDVVGTFMCALRVCGTDGCVPVSNPNVAAPSRRLLASSGTGSFEGSKAVVQAGSSSAAGAAAPLLSVLLALAAAVLAAARM